MLGKEESASLMELLRMEQRPLDEIMAEFNSKFPRSRHFDVCCSLAMLFELQTKELLKPTERLIALGIIIQSYSSHPASANPFISLLVIVACDEKNENYERTFVLQLLGAMNPGSLKEISKQSVEHYIKILDPTVLVYPSREQVQQLFIDKSHSEHTSCFKDAYVTNMVPDPDVPVGCDSSSPEFDVLPVSKMKLGSGDREETLSGLLQNMSPGGLGPQWITVHPPRLPVLEGELMWLPPENNHELLWDHCMGDNRGATIRDFVSKALKGPLPPLEQKQFFKELKNNPKLIYQCGLSPKKLPELVEKNPLMAIELLIKLKRSSKISEYYTILVNMEVNVHSMEVVNRLTTAAKLPKEYVYIYIRNCISSCGKIKDDNDKYKQNRFVRLVCVFLQSLICNNYIDAKEVYIELQSFCTEFSQIRDASMLFKLLKSTAS